MPSKSVKKMIFGFVFIAGNSTEPMVAVERECGENISTVAVLEYEMDIDRIDQRNSSSLIAYNLF